MKAKRVFLIVLDSLGIGCAPDANKFGDEGANTLKRISKSNEFSIPTLINMGLSRIDGVDFLPQPNSHGATVARLRELSMGKDTTTGHWELMGIVSKNPMPTYPCGFPEEIIRKFEKWCRRGVLCNKAYSGTKVIADYGEEHIKTGNLIVYTSADSVFQIAAHEDIVPPDKLYEYCRIAREILKGEHSVGRVIARPFKNGDNGFIRTENRRDFSLEPTAKTALDVLCEEGLDVIGVGKISDIFAGVGITESYHTHGNREGMKITDELAERDFHGLCFVNLVDFDMLYGHRQDTDGYAAALSVFDQWLGKFIRKLGQDDVLMITADHGCDPGDDSTDHTREYVPLLIYGNGMPKNLGTLDGFDYVGDKVIELLCKE